jgi:mRNA interferase MazF
MRRGELYRIHRPSGDPKPYRVYVIVSRPPLIESRFSSVICAPVFSQGEGIGTQVSVGVAEGLKHPSLIMCDNLVSLRKTQLTQFVGSLSATKISELNRALAEALSLS